MTNEQLARLVVEEFDHHGDISDEALKKTWEATEFVDLCQRISDHDERAYEYFLAARERVRPSGIEPRGPEPTAPPWPELQPLTVEDELPAWPVHVLPDWMADHITNMANQLQVPVDLCAQLAVGALSAAAMGHGEVVIGGKWHETVNLYLATAMHSGAGKSPAEKAMTRPLREWERERMAKAKPAILEAERLKSMAEKKAKAAEDAVVRGAGDEHEATRLWMKAAGMDIPPMPRLLADDATPEALVQLLARHDGTMALLSTEADMLDMAAGAYSDGKRPVNLSVYLKGWSGDTIIVDRKGSNSKAGDELRIDAPLLTVSCTMQPTVIDSLRAAGGQLEGRGLLARFMFAVPKSLRGHRDRSMVLRDEADTASAYREQMIALAEQWAAWQTPAIMAFDDDAAQLFIDWTHEDERRLRAGADLAPIAEWLTKCQSSVARLAGLLHMSTGATKGPIGVDVVARAIEVGKYWTSHAKAMAVVTTDDETAIQADLILGWIGRKRPETFTPRELWRTMSRQFPHVTDVVEPLQMLEACGYLGRVEGEWDDVGVQRRVVVVVVNPKVLDHAAAHGSQSVTWRALTTTKTTVSLIGVSTTTPYISPITTPPGKPSSLSSLLDDDLSTAPSHDIDQAIADAL